MTSTLLDHVITLRDVWYFLWYGFAAVICIAATFVVLYLFFTRRD